MDHDMETDGVSTLSWEEAKAMCEEVSVAFDKGLKDGERLRQLKSEFHSLRTILQDQQRSARQTVTDMVNEIQRIQQHEDERDNSAEMQQQIHELNRLKLELQHKLHELKEEQLVSEANIESLILQYDISKQKYAEECAARDKDVPRLKQTIALYAAITGIKWDLSSDHIAGCIHAPSQKNLTSFELRAPHDDFQVADELWRLLDHTHGVVDGSK
ncbi:hypothetical protein H310_11033 [Aphanomyces invadans]|uniref:Kinetochore protein Spc24 n=1 Tax=Aphanomyces invadans TaxID=157072 RepID=A0A024TPP4_9STRA|nr:hypothetical protein H310_11033 [Aphanomyces invadans]ETV95601.1 hypothetical protein H310_11033 [Aphanomyces invadans]|eukprot:XP_008875794.1 hypothetical protein H310_11033 [Aphanomyces invadans]